MKNLKFNFNIITSGSRDTPIPFILGLLEKASTCFHSNYLFVCLSISAIILIISLLKMNLVTGV